MSENLDEYYVKSAVPLHDGVRFQAQSVSLKSFESDLRRNSANAQATILIDKVSIAKKHKYTLNCFVVVFSDVKNSDYVKIIRGLYDVDDALEFAFSIDFVGLPPDSPVRYAHYGAHQLLFTNVGTGKTEIAGRTSDKYESASVARLLGYSTADKTFVGDLHNKTDAVTIDELLEDSSRQIRVDLYGRLFSLMDNGFVKIGKGSMSTSCRCLSSLRFMGNPPSAIFEMNRDGTYTGRVAKSDAARAFVNLLMKMSFNAGALARRIGLITLGDFKTPVLRNDSDFDADMFEVIALQLKQRLSFDFLSAIDKNSKWLDMRFPDDYVVAIRKLQKHFEHEFMLKMFFDGHLESFRHARGVALRYSVLTGEDKDKAFRHVLSHNLRSFSYLAEGNDVFEILAETARVELSSLSDNSKRFLSTLACHCGEFKYSKIYAFKQFDKFDKCFKDKYPTMSRRIWFERLQKDFGIFEHYGVNMSIIGDGLSLCVFDSDLLKKILQLNSIDLNSFV